MEPAVADTVKGRNSTVLAILLNQEDLWMASASSSPITFAEIIYRIVNLKVTSRES